MKTKQTKSRRQGKKSTDAITRQEVENLMDNTLLAMTATLKKEEEFYQKAATGEGGPTQWVRMAVSELCAVLAAATWAAMPRTRN